GQTAIARWEQWHPHLILMDMRMPVMDGYEATRRIKATPQGKTTKIIALTASVLDNEKAITFAVGCDDFLRKPFQTTALLDLLAKHLGVKYKYQTTSPVPTAPGMPLTPDLLATMPRQWVIDLSNVALEADTAQISALIAAIPPQNAILIQSLKERVQNFDFDYIVDLSQQFLHLTRND
ncbi:MAG: response regulator, partial [Synechocystis sp.]|nr:response regulator [Synechocystis sp.]